MKALVITGVIAVLVIGGSVLIPSVNQTVNKTIEIEKEVVPEWAEDVDAVKAAQDVIRRKELEAENEKLDEEVTALTEAYKAEVKVREDRQAQIEKELGF